MIAEALYNLGYSNFVVYDNTFNGIEWVIEPVKKPTEKEVLDAIAALPTKEAQQTARQTKLDSAITKLKALGLTESEANVIIGLE